MSLADTILKGAQFCNIATVCDDGSPWNTPVFFVADEQRNIYWWSSLKAVHSKNILRDGRVYITVLDPKASQQDGRAVYIRAKAKPLEAKDDVAQASKLYNQRSTFVQLKDDITSAKAPTRIFKAEPTDVWLNAEGKVGKYYIDVREPAA